MSDLIVAIVVYLIVGYINQFVAMNQIYHSINQPSMFDRVHSILPVFSKKYPDYGVGLFVLYFILRWGIQYPDAMINYLWIISLLFIGRVIVMSVTQFPPALPNCSTARAGEPYRFNVFQKGWNECLNYMYSGHTIHTVLVALFTVFLSNSHVEKVAVVLLALLELVFIIGSRIHYTADVLVGSLVTVLAFFAWPGIDKVLENIWVGGRYGKILLSKGI